MSAAASEKPVPHVEGIERDPKRCGGAPVLGATRVTVAHVVEQMRLNGWGIDAFREQFPHLQREQIEAALVYYARFPDLVEEEIRRGRSAWHELTRSARDDDPALPR